MKIVHVVHSYYPKIGGIEAAVQHLAEEQAKLDHQVSVITANYGLSNSPKEETINGVKINRLKSTKLFYNDLVIPREDPPYKDMDIIHVHSQNSLFSVGIAEKLKKTSSAKIVFHFMAVDSYKNYPNRLLRIFASYYGLRNTKKALKITDLPIVRSMRDYEILKTAYNVEPKYLPDAIPNSIFSFKRQNPAEFRKKLGVTQTNLFLFIGRMHKFKGPQVLVEALKYLDEDCAAVFIGPDDGYLKKTLDLANKLGVRNRVHILGYVDEATKLSAIDAAVALINPSIADHIEVYSIVLSEAWAREKPVIASKIGEVAYRVKQDVNGILVPPLNPKLLADAMLRILRTTSIAQEMGRIGKVNVFSWGDIANKSIELYSQKTEG